MTAMQRARIAIPIVIVLAAVTWFVTRPETSSPLVASGTVEAIDADLGFQRPGRIASVTADDGDRVTAGDVLAMLDQAQLTAQRRAAAARVDATRARLAELERGARSQEVAQARAAVDAAEQRQEQAARDRERAQVLFAGGAISRQAFDNADTALELAVADRQRAEEALLLVEEGARAEQIQAQRAVVAQAEAALDQADAALADGVITATFDGVVTNRHREPGEVVPAGAPVLTVMDPQRRWVRIYVREDAVGRLSLGQNASITADAYPDRAYRGEVTFIASEAEFTPRNVQTTEERVKLVYEVRVRITEDPTFDLKPGLAADVDLRATP